MREREKEKNNVNIVKYLKNCKYELRVYGSSLTIQATFLVSLKLYKNNNVHKRYNFKYLN